MARYAEDSRERVREAVDMVDLVSARTELRRAGPNRYEGLCPFHDERTPSFGVDPHKKVYHCFGCGVGGDVFTFVQETEGVEFVGALELLADRYDVELQREEEDPQAAERRRRRERLYELLARASEFYARYLWDSEEAADARAYLAARGLAEETLRDFRVGYAPSAWDRMLLAARQGGFSNREVYEAGLAQRAKGEGKLYDRFRARIMFPLADQRGRVLGFGARALRESQLPKYLNTTDGEVYHKGRQLFGADRARAESARRGEVVVVEGYTDVLALHQAGLRNVVGLMGTALTAEQVGELARQVAGADGARIALALDPDTAGQGAMLRAAELAAGRQVELRVVELPPHVDPADLVAGEGAEAVRARVDGSVPFSRFQVDRLLAGEDLGSADGRDRTLARLREVLAPVPAGVLRDELVRRSASRLGLSEQLVASLAAQGATGSTSRGTVGPRAALDRREQTERTFLALCIALPEQGREALRSVDLDQHFTAQATRRAAAHLREHLAAPLDSLSPEDGELRSVVAELALRAARDPAEPATLEVEALQLEKARLEREIAAAQAAGRLDVGELAERRGRVHEQLETAIGRATGRPG
ncbi:MAG: DNA primase [Actinomycetota bacterium]|nr:DNA primase [Actinomycetota bacterium]